MEKNLIYRISNLLCLVILAVIIASSANLIETTPYLYTEFEWHKPHQIVNFLYNSYHTWSFDPLLERLLIYYQTPALIISYSIFFFILGWFLLIRKHLESQLSIVQSNLASLILTLSILTALSLIYQIDLVLLSLFTWVPFFLLATINFLEKKLTSLLYLLIATIFIIQSSNQFSSLIIVFFCSLLTLQADQKISETRKSYQTVVFFLLLLASFYQLLHYPKTNFFDYPVNQRVLLSDYFIGLAQPIFGPSSPIKFLELQHISLAISGIIPVLLLFSIGLVFLGRYKPSSLLVLLLNLIIAFDIYASYELKHILPLETLTRLIPHWSFFPTAIVFSIISIIAIIYLLLAQKCSWLILPFITLLILVDNLNLRNQELALENINVATRSPNFFSEANINSPSAQIYINNPNLDYKKLRKINKKMFRSIKKLHPIINASHNKTDLFALFDKNPNSFWTTKLAQQDGTEWLLIEFPEEVSMRALELSIGTRHTDFPRGLRISSALSCPMLDNDPKIVFEKNPWTGSISFTKLGYPYYTHESKVRIFFPSTLTKCLKIEQLGTNPNFEWAINEISFLK